MKQNGAVYFYNLNSAKGRQIRMLCLKQGLKIRVVDQSQYEEAIGAIAGVPGYVLKWKALTVVKASVKRC